MSGKPSTKTLSLTISLALALILTALVLPVNVNAAPTVYINTNFDDGTLQGWPGGSASIGTTSPFSGGAEGSSKYLWDPQASCVKDVGAWISSYYISCYVITGSISSRSYAIQTMNDTNVAWVQIGLKSGTIEAYNSSSGWNTIASISNNVWHHVEIWGTKNIYSISVDSGTPVRITGINYANNGPINKLKLSAYSATAIGFDSVYMASSRTLPEWKPSFTSTPEVSGQVGSSYSYTPTTNESATISAPTLPTWATYSGGTISGTPSATGTYAFEVKATSSAGTLDAFQYWNVTVGAAPVPSTWPPSFTSSPPGIGEVGQEYSYIPRCNESVSYELETSPSWAGWVDGAVMGLPNEAGESEFSLRAIGSGTLARWQNWTVTITDPTPVPAFTNSPDTNATRRVWYSWTPEVNLSPCYFTLNGSAGWLSINQYSGKVSGLPTSAGAYNITVTAYSLDYQTSANLTYIVTVADALDPPQDTGDDSGGTDGGGSDNGGTIIAAIPDYYLVTGLVILAILVIAIIGASRRR